MMFWLSRASLVISVVILLNSQNADAVAVMSIDLGSEWMKVAIVSPGVPMEIALNKESQRKTPVVVSFRDGERLFGDPAAGVGVRFPDKAYAYFLELLGKKVDNPMVQLFQKRFPYYTIVPDERRGTVVLKHPEGMLFTPEELVAMVFKNAQEIAEHAAGQTIKDAVITVPVYFNQAERRAVLHAADMAGLKVLQLINDNTAVALNFGIFRRKDFNESMFNIMFYDMGASSTVATIVTYQVIKSKEGRFIETNPQLTVRGIGFDRSLGGLEVQLRLRDHLAKLFNEQKKTSNDVFQNNRALSKLFKEAGRVKKVLSANPDHYAQVESLLDDQDFRASVSREDLERLCDDVFERVANPVKMALEAAGMTIEEIDQVVLKGAGTRVPKVQQKLLEVVGKSELGKSINTDEAAALGAAYQAAHLSKGFKVKPFNIKDANIYPIQVEFQREFEQDDGSLGIKVVSRILFSRNNPFPQKKLMTFSRHVKDFEISVKYAELNFLPGQELGSLGDTNLSRVSLSGVSNALNKHREDGSEYKGIKAHFRMDESGLLHLDQAEAVFEKKVLETEENKEQEFESTLSRLGSTIGKLFSGSSGRDEPPEEKDQQESPKNESEEKPKSEQPDQQEKAEKQDEEESAKVDKQSKENKTEESKAAENKTAEEQKTVPKVNVVKEHITIQELKLDLSNLSEDESRASRDKLLELDEKDRDKLQRDQAKNNLESFIHETKHKLYMEEYEKASTEEERNGYFVKLNEASEWFEYESDNAETKLFKDKLSELKDIVKELFDRVREHKERPEALNSLKEMLNISRVFYEGAKNLSEEDQMFTEVELSTLETLIKETEEWKKNSEKEQATLPLYERPKLTVRAIAEKLASLDREVKYLLNKARIATPKKKKETEKADSKESTEKQQEEKETQAETPDSAKEEKEDETQENEDKLTSSAFEEKLQLDYGTDRVKEDPSDGDSESQIPVTDDQTPRPEL